ncbi:MAG: sigma-70 family RNA polymerase sigma factor [Caldilineaceae bacterium]
MIDTKSKNPAQYSNTGQIAPETVCEAQRGAGPTEDQLLLAACSRGEEWAWVQLVKKYERLVFSIALNHGLSPDDAADVTQIAFTALLDSLPKLRPDSAIAAWLATVARRHSWRIRP